MECKVGCWMFTFQYSGGVVEKISPLHVDEANFLEKKKKNNES